MELHRKKLTARFTPFLKYAVGFSAVVIVIFVIAFAPQLNSFSYAQAQGFAGGTPTQDAVQKALDDCKVRGIPATSCDTASVNVAAQKASDKEVDKKLPGLCGGGIDLCISDIVYWVAVAVPTFFAGLATAIFNKIGRAHV